MVKKVRGKVRFDYPAAVPEWEKHRDIRDRVMAKKGMFMDTQGRGFVSATLPNSKLNRIFLKQYTTRMVEKKTTKVGSLDELKQPIKEFHDVLKVDCPFRQHQDTWAAKRLLGLLRRKFVREEEPRDP